MVSDFVSNGTALAPSLSIVIPLLVLVVVCSARIAGEPVATALLVPLAAVMGKRCGL